MINATNYNKADDLENLVNIANGGQKEVAAAQLAHLWLHQKVLRICPSCLLTIQGQ
jgi:hypothetical protein